MWFAVAWDWFRKNIPDWVVIVVAALGGVYLIDWRARQDEKRKQKDAAKIATGKTIDKIEEKSNEMVRKAEQVRARDVVLPADPSLPDAGARLPDIHYRD